MYASLPYSAARMPAKLLPSLLLLMVGLSLVLHPSCSTKSPTGPVGGFYVEMVYVEGGTLPDIGTGVLDVEAFFIGKYEVTWGEWQAVREWAVSNGYDLSGVGAGCADDHPAHSVNWYEVVKWCNALSEMEGRTPVYTVGGTVYRTGEHDDVSVNESATGYRLPTFDEWEYAARGGRQSRGYRYSGSDEVNAVAWYRDNSGGAACNLFQGRGTWPVGGKAPNELGLYDMSGNVWEWCFDYRIFRGGGWNHNADSCRVGRRTRTDPGSRHPMHGFRLVARPRLTGLLSGLWETIP